MRRAPFIWRLLPRLLLLLHPLPLLGLPLLQLLRLLLMALLELLHPRLVVLDALVLAILPLLQPLPVPVLLSLKLLLLLLIFPVATGVSGVQRSRPFARREVVRVNYGPGRISKAGFTSRIAWTIAWTGPACGAIRRGVVWTASLSSGHNVATAEGPGSCGGGHGRSALVS